MTRRMLVLLFVAVLFVALIISFPVAGNAGLHAPPLPPLVVPAPPPVILIPGTYAYFAPDVDAELIFYSGSWYRLYEGGWYRAKHYNGPWGVIGTKRVPRDLIKLPPAYRSELQGRKRISYIQLRKNWKTWERHKHWDKPRKRKAGKTKKHDQSEHVPGKGDHGR